MRSNLLPLFAAIAPFLIWPIEFVLPYPHIIEELVKAHASTFLILSLFPRRFFPLALIAAILLHWAYNLFI
ncbi:MAG: hypothetical protein UX42_C0024G0020 [Microgenomates group bacterium GW2011_GWC1_46_20]|nr:MAG: hypothetical protein UX42_C0024G0020 [Microgenomates group bacterium GW2011_GWC1_46_20]